MFNYKISYVDESLILYVYRKYCNVRTNYCIPVIINIFVCILTTDLNGIIIMRRKSFKKMFLYF